MDLTPIGFVKDIKADSYPATEGGKKIGGEKGEGQDIEPSKTHIKIEHLDRVKGQEEEDDACEYP
ncbi:MAG: hypothetical protein JRJ02_08410 [Deltaproteobacteria bacterium]|nr:hypothetical protein [Deltaproteobacteria bacterium]